METTPAKEIPIGLLAELTGVAPTTLRAWERRHGLLKPRRTAGGHRLYSAADVATVRRIRERLAAGEPIGRAVRALHADTPPPAPAPGANAWQSHRERLLAAIERFDPLRLERTYTDLLSLFPVDRVVDGLLRPVIRVLGERWERRPGGIAEEHFFTSFLRNKVGARLHHQAPFAGGPLLVAACLPGERHELGLLLFCLEATGLGYRFLHLGPDLPLDQVDHAARRAGADGVLLSSTSSSLDDALAGALERLAGSLGRPVCIGGVDDAAAARSIGGVVTLGGTPDVALARLGEAVPLRRRARR